MKAEPELNAPERKILDLLLAADKPLTAYAILDKLRRRGVRSPPTVYRALDRLLGLGLAHRLESLGAFVACRHAHEAAAAHGDLSSFVICTSCGTVEELEDPALARVMRKLESHLAKVERKVFEMAGTCHACGEKKKESAHV